MSLDTFTTIWNRVLLSCPLAGPGLARTWVSYAFRQVAERRPWSWRIKFNQFISPALYNTGTVDVVNGSTAVVGHGTTFTALMIGRQFRLSTATPIYTISAFSDPQHITLASAWGAATASLSGYEIYQCYFTVPTDFDYFLTVWDPNFNWQLYRNFSQTELNIWDAQRANRGQAYVVASLDYNYETAGSGVPLPRYEIWPHQTAQYVYPYLYVARATDLEDSGATLPRYIRGDVLVELALASAARWPGPSREKANPYYSIPLAAMHDNRAERMIKELEIKDDERYETDVTYITQVGLPFAPFGDSAWLQSHAI